MRIAVQFAPEQSETNRRRLNYACRLFCAVYGHEFCGESDGAADVLISYGGRHRSFKPAVTLANRYVLRAPQLPAPAPQRYSVEGQRTWLIHGLSEGLQPDWLGEIFEWISCAHEYSVRGRDAIGRVPFAESYCGTYRLDPTVPHAAMAMGFLQRAIAAVVPICPLAPATPQSGIRHLVVNTHDIDFLPASRWSNAARLVKNSLISAIRYRQPGSAVRQAISALSALSSGHNALDQMESLLKREVEEGISATYLFLTRRIHAHDANYDVFQPETINVMRSVEARGMEVALHGSFTSLDSDNGLAAESTLLRDRDFEIIGNRQHWLRFTPGRLIEQVEQSDLSYDCSYGWPDQIGFRAGACFPFPPYDFTRECAANFIEIPLVLMDVAMVQQKLSAEELFDAASRTLRTSREFGWGGISVLWHNTAFGGGQLPKEIGQVFWRLVEEGKSSGDCWCSGRELMALIRDRYLEVGLLASKQFAGTVA